MKLTQITISVVIGLCVGFLIGSFTTLQIGYQNTKAQIVKEALSNVPQDLSDPKVAKEFKAMIRKFKGGKR